MAGLRADQWLTLGVVVACVAATGLTKTTHWVVAGSELQPQSHTVTLVKPAPVPVPDVPGAQLVPPSVSAQAVMVQDVASGSILLEKSSTQPRSPASTTKLLTALVAKHIYPLDQIVTIGEEAFSQGTVMQLTVGEQLTVHNLLYGLLMTSGNDAAFALANHHQLGYSGFVAAMNQAAKEWSLKDTHFTNPSGLDQTNHLTTARDLALLARIASQDQVVRPILSTKQYTISDITGQRQHQLRSTNQLLGADKGVVAGKTGTTELAGEVLVSIADVKGHEVAIVVMGSSDRYGDTSAILDWLKQHYRWIEPE